MLKERGSLHTCSQHPDKATVHGLQYPSSDTQKLSLTCGTAEVCKIICQGRRGSQLLALACLPSLLSGATAVVHWCLEGCSKAFGAAS